MMKRWTKYIVLGLMVAAPLLSQAQKDDNRPWWKKLFKKETVDQLEDENPPVDTPSNLPEDEPGQVILDKDSVNLTPPVFTGPGIVHISAPAEVDSLNSFKQKKIHKLDGYRVQIFQGSVAESKGARSGYVSKRLGDRCYLVQSRPYFSVRVGDFRTELEAYKRLREIRKYYPGAYVVADKIEWPKLKD